jgi:hypothetical protein
VNLADWLSIIGFALAGIGSSLGMLGVFKQAQPFTSISMWKFPEHIVRVLFEYLRKGKAEGDNYIRTTALTGSAGAQAAGAEPAATTGQSAAAEQAGTAENGAAIEKGAAAGPGPALKPVAEPSRAPKGTVNAEIVDSLVALYCIFFGFVLQFAGALLLLIGSLLAPHCGSTTTPHSC